MAEPPDRAQPIRRPASSANELGVALPFFFRGPRPKVRVINPATGGRSVVCDIVDVRPWNTNDPYWETGSRPQAEAGVARDRRKTNLAGIDLTPCSARCRHRRQGTGGLGVRRPLGSRRGPQIMVDGLMQRLEQLERLINARRDDTQLRLPGDSTIFRPPGDLTIFRDLERPRFPPDPNDIGASLGG